MSETFGTLLQGVAGATAFEARHGGLWMDAPDLDVSAAAGRMNERGARLSTITATLLDGGETRVIYHYTLGAAGFNLAVRTRGNGLPSITPQTPAADWPEREIMDLFAVTFEGHPNPARLIRPVQLQPGYFREAGGAAGKAAREA